ncbi:hypothetical protein KKA15_01385 [Patescibacteria group bacterium]|nr:hypothetical protein [Patescibacteria group bacterium]
MQPIFWMIIIIAVLVVIIGIIAIITSKPSREEYKRTGKHPKGHYIGMGMAFGIALGMPFGVALDNIAFGPGLGLPIGLAIGMAMEQKYKDKLRELTPVEKKMKKIAVLSAFSFLIVGMIAGFVLFWLGAK